MSYSALDKYESTITILQDEQKNKFSEYDTFNAVLIFQLKIQRKYNISMQYTKLVFSISTVPDNLLPANYVNIKGAMSSSITLIVLG